MMFVVVFFLSHAVHAIYISPDCQPISASVYLYLGDPDDQRFNVIRC